MTRLINHYLSLFMVALYESHLHTRITAKEQIMQLLKWILSIQTNQPLFV